MNPWWDNDVLWADLGTVMFAGERLEAAKREVDSILQLFALKPGASILDLCCGVGRHSLELARRGFRVTGVDRTRAYLERARRAAADEHLDVEFVQADVRDFVRVDEFDGAVSMFTSIGYFDSDDEDVTVLRHVCESLRPGGRLLIDTQGKEALARRFREREWFAHADGSIEFEERKLIDGWRRIETRWILLRGAERSEVTFNIRLYAGSELADLLRRAGFANVALYGSLTGTPYDQRAERLVAVATK